MMSLLCDNCRNFCGQGNCLAFPEGIPYEIASGMVDHRLPYPGDRGFRYEEVHPLDLDPPTGAAPDPARLDMP